MQTSRTILLLLLVLACLISTQGCSDERAVDPVVTGMVTESSKNAPVPYNVFELAESESITSGSDFDMMGRRALGIDDFGTLHAIYQRAVGLDQVLYYVSKPPGGEWSEPEIVGAAGTYPGVGWLEVRKETGEAYVAFYQPEGLTLGIRRAGGWEFHTLETPEEYGVSKPALAIDQAGNAHIAMVINWKTPIGSVVWQMGYAYFDGSSDIHFQLLEESWIPHYALFAAPDIVARPDGSVVIAFHHGQDGQMLIRVEENNELGGTVWSAETVDVRNVIVYPQSLELDDYGDLHIAFHTNIELGASHRVYYAVRRDTHFGAAVEVSGEYTGARPRIAFTPDDEPHLVFEETIGALCTGRLIHAYKEHGKWLQEVIAENEVVNPSFVTDAQGNGNIIFEHRILLMENHDIKYKGYVAPLQ